MKTCAVEGCDLSALHDRDDEAYCLRHLIEQTEPQRQADRLAQFDEKLAKAIGMVVVESNTDLATTAEDTTEEGEAA